MLAPKVKTAQVLQKPMARPTRLRVRFCVRRSSPAEGALATGAELSLPKAKNATLRLMVSMTPADPTSNLTNPFLLSDVNPEPTTTVVFLFCFVFCFVRADHERRRDPSVRREGLDQAVPGADRLAFLLVLLHPGPDGA